MQLATVSLCCIPFMLNIPVNSSTELVMEWIYDTLLAAGTVKISDIKKRVKARAKLICGSGQQSNSRFRSRHVHSIRMATYNTDDGTLMLSIFIQTKQMCIAWQLTGPGQQIFWELQHGQYHESEHT